MRLLAKEPLSFRLTLIAALGCAALLPPVAPAAGWEFSSAVNYDTGKYGAGNRTDSVYVPFTLKRSFANADLSVTAPYLRQSSRGQVTRVGGRPVRANAGTGAAVNSAGSGLGDIMAAGADFNNEIMLDVGFYSPLSKSIGLTVLYETRSAVVDGTADPRSVSGTFSYSAPGDAQFSGGVTLGLSDGSPGLGIGAAFSRQF